MSSSGGPTTEIWKKWSMTHSEASPLWSASRATARHVAPVEAGAPGQLKRLTCSPSFIPLILPRDRARGTGQRYWPVLATVLIDLPGSVPSLVLMRVRM